MNKSTPHYLLQADASRGGGSGHWRFVLRSVDGSEQIEVADTEPDVRGERLDLLTVVRGLEALDQPSRVTLQGCTRYVRHGVQYGLAEWRGNGWRWEYFGQMVPVKNGDLWQRLERALRFHHLECKSHRIGRSPACQDIEASAPNKQTSEDTRVAKLSAGGYKWVKCDQERRRSRVVRRLTVVVRLAWWRLRRTLARAVYGDGRSRSSWVLPIRKIDPPESGSRARRPGTAVPQPAYARIAGRDVRRAREQRRRIGTRLGAEAALRR